MSYPDEPFGPPDYPEDLAARLPSADLRQAASIEYPELAPTPAQQLELRFRRLEEALAEQAAAHARELADQQAKNELLAAQLREAQARPDKLRAPGEFVGREGAPDSPVLDHYRLVLANGDVMPAVHPGVSHVAIGDDLVPVIRVYHSAAVQRAQHSQAA